MRALNWAFSLILLMVSGLAGRAQDSHYNGQQPDAKGTLGGGTGTAGCREVSAIFYNPGIIAFFNETNLGLSGNLYAFDMVNVNDEELPLSGSQLQVMPSMFVVSLKIFKNPRMLTTFGFFNNGFYHGRVRGQRYDVVPSQNEKISEFYSFDIRTVYKNDWFGGSLSYRLNENWGIGGGLFVNTINKSFRQGATEVISVAGDPAGEKVIRSWGDTREFNAFSPGILMNFGLSYRKGNHEWGLTLVTPRINLTGFAYSSVERFYQETDSAGNDRFSILSDAGFKSFFKRPVEVNVGYAYTRGFDMLRARVAFHAGADAYANGRTGDEVIRTGVFNQPDEFGFLPMEALLPVINVGLGYDVFVHERLSMLFGFRTDFTYFDDTGLTFSDFSTRFIRWNIFRASAGVQWAFKQFRFNSGIEYGFQFNQSASHLVDFGETDKPFTEIPRNSTATVSYNQFKIFVGLDFRFLRD